MPRSKAVAKKANKEEKSKSAKKEVENEDNEDKQEEEVEEKTSKTKPIIKAKKYKQKTYEQLARINRSKHQRIFLIEAKRMEEQNFWTFIVQGTKGSNYHVNVSTEVKCTCMDFKLKKKPCKHIYFIVTQVGQNEELLDYFRDKKTISKNAYKLLDQQLMNRLKSRLDASSKDAKDIDLKDDKDCVICFSQMEKETEPLEDCGTCKKYFHSECLGRWKNQNPSCPLCRGPLAGSRSDPLGLLGKVDI